MPAINLDLSDDDYSRAQEAAQRERLPLKTFARTALLARTTSTPTAWTLATYTAEAVAILSSSAQKLMHARRGVSPEDQTYRANACLWLHLTAAANIVAYPTAHYTSSGTYEFLLDRADDAQVLFTWSDDAGLSWEAGDSSGQHSAQHLAVAIGNHRLGIPKP